MFTPTAPRITRQPIYDEQGALFGFELLAAPGPQRRHGADSDRAGARAMIQGILSGLLDGLAGGTRIVLEVPGEILLAQVGDVLPAGAMAVKVPPGRPVARPLVEVLTALRARGALVVLSGLVRSDPRAALLGHADVVGVDLSGDRHRGRLPVRGETRGLPLLAEGIETAEAFTVARGLGATWFQGGVFVGSAVLDSGGPPGFRPVHAALLQAASRPELDYGQLERILKQDVQLTHAFLRYVNAAFFGWRSRITSLSHAFVLMGEGMVRSWATLVVLADLAGDRPQQVAVTAAVRARFCELLGGQARAAAQPLELFTLGMFSILDVLLGRPMREVLAELPLSAPVHEALLGADTDLRAVLDAVVAYEEGDWQALDQALEILGAEDDRLLEHYLSAVDWAASTFDRSFASG